MGSEIGGTGKAQKREKGASRQDRKLAGTAETENQRKEMMMGYTVLGLLLLLALALALPITNHCGRCNLLLVAAQTQPTPPALRGACYYRRRRCGGLKTARTQPSKQ